jgi:Spy/CpxP family protein refolding chaperone
LLIFFSNCSLFIETKTDIHSSKLWLGWKGTARSNRFGESENRLSPLSPLRKRRGEALRGSEAFRKGVVMPFKLIILVLVSLMAGVIGVMYVSADNDTSYAQGKMWQKMAKNLGLTPDQQAKLKDLRADMGKQNKITRDKIKTLREKEKEELLIPNPSQQALYGYAKEINDLQGAMAEKRLEHLLKVKEVLAPDQFKKLLSMTSRMGKGRQWKNGGHGSAE